MPNLRRFLLSTADKNRLARIEKSIKTAEVLEDLVGAHPALQPDLDRVFGEVRAAQPFLVDVAVRLNQGSRFDRHIVREIAASSLPVKAQKQLLDTFKGGFVAYALVRLQPPGPPSARDDDETRKKVIKAIVLCGMCCADIAMACGPCLAVLVDL